MNIRRVINIKEEIHTYGHSPLRVICDNYEEYFVKNTRKKRPPYEILNEFISSAFLRIWNIPTPDSALVTVPQELITDELSSAHQKHYYEDYCFGSKTIENAIDSLDFALTIDSKSYRKIINPVDFYRICLFDNWVHNDDRKATNYNLLFEPIKKGYQIQAIDHAFIFETLPYDTFANNDYFPSANDHILVSEIGHLIKKYLKVDNALVEAEKENFYLCVAKSEREFSNIVVELQRYFEISNKDLLSLQSILFNSQRNKDVFQEHVLRLKQ
jgi:hypothetical protein